jgi:hypothetical protein
VLPVKATFMVQATMTLAGVSVDVFNSHPAYRNAFVKSVAAQCNVGEEFVVITEIIAARRRLAGRRLADSVKIEYKVGAETKEAADQAKNKISAISSTDQAAFVSIFTENFGVEKAAAEAAGDTVAALPAVSFTVQDVSAPTAVVDADGSGTVTDENKDEDGGFSTGALAGIVAAVLVVFICGGMIFSKGQSSEGGNPGGRGASNPPRDEKSSHAEAPPVKLETVEGNLQQGQVAGRDKPEYTF